jgi:hypothetical protein
MELQVQPGGIALPDRGQVHVGRGSARTCSARRPSPPPMSECTVSIGATAARPSKSCSLGPVGTLSPWGPG